MSIFSRMFGARTPLDRVRRALAEQRWSDALSIGEHLGDDLEADEASELESLLIQAGDGLGRLNLTEAEACLRAGDRSRATEHLDLAADQVRSPELAERVGELRKGLGAPLSAPPEVRTAGGGHCGSGCSGSSVDEATPGRDLPEDAHSLDSEGRFELILAGYPSFLASRYQDRGKEFRSAFMLAHEGSDEEALEAFERLPTDERDDLFHFERGALLARMGQVVSARRELETAITRNGAHTLANETLVDFELSAGEESSAKHRLEDLLKRQMVPAFCHSRLAILAFRSGDREGAVDHGLAAIEAGYRDSDIVLLTASILEEGDCPDQAESLLMRLSGGGCSGGVNVPLAEFWLRQEKNPDKALEIFKGAVRQDPENPRWPFRMAESYFAIGWRKEGLKLLQKALADPRLEPELQKQGRALLSPGT